MELMFLLLLPVIIVVLPILAALGIPFRAVLIVIGIFFAFITLISKWICEGAKASYLWCLLPAGISALCFLGAHFISYDLNLMHVIQNLFR